MSAFDNPGPNTSVCPNCGDTWLIKCRHITDKQVITASQDYAETLVRCCGVCGAPVKSGLDVNQSDVTTLTRKRKRR